MKALSEIIDRHKGQPFLVCGTAPSIDQYPREWYLDWPGVVIGVNDILDLFTPDYWMNIHEVQNTLFCNIRGREERIGFGFHNPSTQIASEKTGNLSIVGTIAVAAMTAAYQLGAAEIHLIGIDLKTRPDQAHFNGCSSHYIKGGSHFLEHEDQVAATVRTFKRAYMAYGAKGVKIVNLSQNSLLPGSNDEFLARGAA